MRARRSALLALCTVLALTGCKKGSGSSDGGIDGAEDACDLSTEPRYDAAAPIPIAPDPSLPNIFDAWGTAPNDFWAVGSAGLVMHWDGTSWHQEATPPVAGDLLSISGMPPDELNPVELYAVGLGGTILRFDGTSWGQHQMPLNDGGVPLTADLHAVAVGGRGIATAVGVDATMVETNNAGATWALTPVPTQETLNGVWRRGSGAVAVGNLGTIIEWDGSAWQRRRITGLTAHLKGVYGWDASNVFAFGLNGTFLSNQGGTWQKLDRTSATFQPRDIECQQAPAAWPSVYLRDGWGTSDGKLLIVGWSGTLLLEQGGTSTVYQVTEQRLESVWGTRIQDTPDLGDAGAAAIPDGGIRYHYEGVIVGVSGAVIRFWLHGNP